MNMHFWDLSFDPAPVQVEDWCLVDRDGNKYKLPKTMLFMGSEECDIVVREFIRNEVVEELRKHYSVFDISKIRAGSWSYRNIYSDCNKSQTVDKRHAVITFDHYLNKFKIKDLTTANGTFVNEDRIQDQEYVTLEHMDSVRLGYDSMVYRMEEVREQDVNFNPEPEEVPLAPNNMPSWATKELPQQMAECQGCIAEQRIEHTCATHEDQSDFQHGNHQHMVYETVQGYHEYSECSENKQQIKDLGCNTWPRKRHRNTKNISTYFTDEMTNGNSVDNPDHPHSRILRGESSHPENLPSEFETLKKATPLYGQPNWWGEDDADQKVDDNPKPEHALKDTSKPMDHKQSPPKHKDMIQLTETQSVASSLSRDSLFSHDPGGVPESSGQEREDKGDNSSSAKPSEGSAGSVSMAFTVDFDADTPKMNMSGKLSEFMPSKIRKSFRERKEMMARTTSKDVSPEKEDPPKKVESGDVSPVDRQKKIDDLWEPPENKKKHTPEATRRSSRSHDLDTQRKTPEVKRSTRLSSDSGKKTPEAKKLTRSSLGSDSGMKTPEAKKLTRSSLGSDSGKRTPEVRRSSRSHDLETENKPVTAVSARGTSTKTHKRKVVSGEPKKSVSTRQKDEELKSSAVTESASYLIDKMFESSNNKNSKNSSMNKASDHFTEHAMYKEAKQYETSRNSADLKITTKEQSTCLLPEKDVDEVKDNHDKVSEAGTYTIEADIDDSEERKEREKIDEVFCVTNNVEEVLSQCYGKKNDVINETSNEGEVTLEVLESEIDSLEKRRSGQPTADSMDAEVGSHVLEELRIVEDDENASNVLPDDAPAWVTQWAALTSQKHKSADMEAPSPSTSSVHSISSEKDELRGSSKKTSQGLRRRGTGRKLPRVPIGDKGSPSGSEYSLKLSESTGSPSGFTPRENGDSGKMKAVTISSHVTSRCEDTDTEKYSKTKFSASDNDSTVISTSRLLDPGSERKRNGSSRSTRSSGSVDTELLLKDTETVMAAMEARMGTDDTVQRSRNNDEMNGHDESFSDTDSMVAMVNGDENYLKPTLYESPRANLTKSSAPKQQQQQKVVLSRTKSAGARLNAFRENLKRQQSVDKSVVSDVVSEVQSDNSICGSENEEYGANFTRTSSKGKGKMSMTRPNRAFELRRARAEGDEPATPNTATTASSFTSVSKGANVTPKSSSRRSTGTDRSDRTYEPSARSDASLGAQIVARSRINNARSTGDLVRRDGGRHSLRMSSRSLSTQDSSSSHSDVRSEVQNVRKSDFKSIKARLKNPPSYGLTVTGVSTKSKSASASASNSRSSSPKSAEKAAWQRRKAYDPRKAVAEAKVKARETRNSSYTTESSKNTSSSRKMTRSASFTNTSELRHYHKDVKSESLSSTDDISTNSELTDNFDERTLSNRSFIPYTGRSHSSRLYHSSEDEEIGLMVKSSQDLSRSFLGSVPYMSAFTPPPPKFCSPESPSSPIIPLSIFKPQVHSISSHYDHLRKSTHIQSYDNILVSSIYQLSLKLKTATDKSLQKLRNHKRIENGSSPSPIDDLFDQSAQSDMPAWKSANQELAGILNNLRKIDHHVHVMNAVLFPGEDSESDTSASKRREKQEYLQEIERIRGELAGFQPINTPDESWKLKDGDESIESDCEELGVPEEFF